MNFKGNSNNPITDTLQLSTLRQCDSSNDSATCTPQFTVLHIRNKGASSFSTLFYSVPGLRRVFKSKFYIQKKIKNVRK